MHNTLRHIVDATVSSSHLNAEEKDDLRKELMSHMHDYEHELQLRGMKEEEIARTIAESFGSPQEIGKQLYMVHKRFERIPLIGPLLYYTPVIISVKLFFSHLFLAVFPAGMTFLGSLFNTLALDDRISFLFIALIIIYSVGQGVWTQQHIPRFADACEALILSHIPFLIITLLYALNRTVFQGQEWRQLWFILIIIGIHMGVMLIGMSMQFAYRKFSQQLKKSV